MEQKQMSLTKVKDLSPSTRQVDLLAKVVSVGEKRTIDSKFGGSRNLCEAVVGDETGTVIFSLWEDQIGRANAGDVIQVNNAYVSLVRGHMRLNVGKYGTFQTSDKDVGDVNTENDLSAAEHERPQREFRGGGGGRGGNRRFDGGPRKTDRGRRRF